MKTRNGFVSNSSSSSFLLAIKSGETLDALEKLNDGLNPFSDIINEVIDTIKTNAELVDEHVGHEHGYKTIEEYLANWYGPSVWKSVQQYVRNGYTIYSGTFSSESDNPVEVMLCGTSLNYTSDDLVIIHEGGY